MKQLLIVGLIAWLAGFGVGFGSKGVMVEAEKAAELQAALDKQAEIERRSRQQEIDLIKSQQKTKTVYKTIVKEVPKYVTQVQKTDSDCNLSVGTVRLFNDAAAERLPETTGNDDADNTRPSTVKESDLIGYGLEVIEQYNKAKNQCNALIKWHESTTQTQ